jgi:hypothetical protein
MESELTRVVKQMNESLSDKRSFDYFINYVWDYDNDYNKDEIVLYKNYLEKLDKKENKVLYSGFTFITLSPDHLKRKIDYSEENIRHLIDFCKAQFTEFNYSFAKWVVESGKHSEDPHLHIHAFVRIKNPKHHKRDLLCLWCKFFPKLIDSDYHTIKCNTEDMWRDKQNYMLNDRKGTHMNFEDLAETFGALGSCGVITSK